MTHLTPDEWARLVTKSRAARQARADWRHLKANGYRLDALAARRLALRLEAQIRAAAGA